jgi:hypothetical protein
VLHSQVGIHWGNELKARPKSSMEKAYKALFGLGQALGRSPGQVGLTLLGIQNRALDPYFGLGQSLGRVGPARCSSLFLDTR